MQALLTMIYGIIMAFERRWLGGGFYDCHRIWKNIVYVLILCTMVFTAHRVPTDWLICLSTLWYIGWTIRYFNHSHSGMFHLYSNTPFKPKYKWVETILNKLFGKGKWYNFAGKFVGLTLGYLVPAIMASITMPSHYFWIAGFTTPVCYAICEGMLPKEIDTECAEFSAGFLMGITFYCNLI